MMQKQTTVPEEIVERLKTHHPQCRAARREPAG